MIWWWINSVTPPIHLGEVVAAVQQSGAGLQVLSVDFIRLPADFLAPTSNVSLWLSLKQPTNDIFLEIGSIVSNNLNNTPRFFAHFALSISSVLLSPTFRVSPLRT
jgi:hypothetical protein